MGGDDGSTRAPALESTEDLIARSTFPVQCEHSTREELWSSLADEIIHANSGSFCENVLRLLAHRIQSPMEREALHALELVDYLVITKCSACETFIQQVGKYRFLNEIIKIISPKYLGERTPKAARDRAIEILYSWTCLLKQVNKVREAYELLKRQGIISRDPEIANNKAVNAKQSQQQGNRKRHPIFDDDKKARMLKKLLQSKDAEDIELANRLIQGMIQEDDRLQEKISRWHSQVQVARNNAMLLQELIAHCKSGASSKDERELLKQLQQSCEKLRPQMAKMAAEVASLDNSDEEQSGYPSLASILSASDQLSEVMVRFRALDLDAMDDNSTNNDNTARGLEPSLVELDQNDAPEVKKVRGRKVSGAEISTAAVANTQPARAADELADLDLLMSDDIHVQHSQSVMPLTTALHQQSSHNTNAVAETILPDSPAPHRRILDDSRADSARKSATAALVLNTSPTKLLENNAATSNNNKSDPFDFGLEHLGMTSRTQKNDEKKPTLKDMQYSGAPTASGENHNSQSQSAEDPSSSKRVSITKLPLKESTPSDSSVNMQSKSSSSDNPLQDLYLTSKQLDIKPDDSILCYEDNNVTVLVFKTRNHPARDCSVYFVDMLNSNAFTLKCVELAVSCKEPFHVKLVLEQPQHQHSSSSSSSSSFGRELPGYNPLRKENSLHQILFVHHPRPHQSTSFTSSQDDTPVAPAVNVRFTITYMLPNQRQPTVHTAFVRLPIDDVAPKSKSAR